MGIFGSLAFAGALVTSSLVTQCSGGPVGDPAPYFGGTIQFMDRVPNGVLTHVHGIGPHASGWAEMDIYCAASKTATVVKKHGIIWHDGGVGATQQFSVTCPAGSPYLISKWNPYIEPYNMWIWKP